MKLTFLFLAVLFISGTAIAEEKHIATPFVFNKAEKATELVENEAIFVFEFQGITKEERSAKIIVGIDGGENETIKLNNGKFEYKVTPGTHVFAIYLNTKYYEMYSPELAIDAQEKHFYWVSPWLAEPPLEELEKPVIYLYPESSQSFKVSVIPAGEMLFTYPEYGDGWKGTMHPDGSLDINGELFNYLFWESKQKVDALNAYTSAGFVVQQANIVSFLEDKLNTVGFTAKERADFITYWGPRMQKCDQVFVTFHQDADCDRFAELNITPQPDNLHRFYMSWGSFDGTAIPEQQELTPFNRTGFTAIEWGGQEVSTISNTLNP